MALAAPLALAGCGHETRPAPAPAPAAAAGLVEITLLYTSDEHGWLAPFKDAPAHGEPGGRAATWGGAAEVLGAWITREGHCPGAPPHDLEGAALAEPARLDLRAPGCAAPRTIAISGGDNFTGPAVTTFFAGAPMAQALARMGYVASAFGNHEFDFGRERFVRNRNASGVTYVAANMRSSLADVTLPPFTIAERLGVRVAIVGLATDTTLSTAMASRFTGIEFLDEERPLDAAIRAAWAQHPDVVVVVAHECPERVAPMLQRHPEWQLAFFGSGHCHKVVEEVIDGTPLVSPGWRFAHYVRVPIVVDKSRPEQHRVVHTRAEIVDVTHDDGEVPPVDAPLAALVASYEARLETALGETIGFSRDGMKKDSSEIARWIAGAWRAELHADAAIINMGGIRQAVARGPVTLATVWSVMPFDNKLVLATLSGKDLAADARIADMATVGVVDHAGKLALADGRPIEPEAHYSVATIDFLYLGGAHVPMRTQDPQATDTGIDWREPVIAWTKRVARSQEAPIESRLASGLVVMPP